jgi:hypothetical protein
MEQPDLQQTQQPARHPHPARALLSPLENGGAVMTHRVYPHLLLLAALFAPGSARADRAITALTQKLRAQTKLKQQTEARAAKQQANQLKQQAKLEKQQQSESVEELRKVAKEYKEPLRLSGKPMVFSEEKISHVYAGGTIGTQLGEARVPEEKVTGTKRLELNAHGLQEVTRTTSIYGDGRVESKEKAETIALPGKFGRAWTRVQRALEMVADGHSRTRLPESVLRRYQGALTKEKIRKAADEWVKEHLAP